MDVASKQQKTLKNVLYYGLPVLAILMIAVGWVLFSGSHPELMPAPADVWARFVKTFTKPIAKTSLAGHAWASLRRVLMALLIAWAFGISFGILIGWNKKCKAFFGSIFEVIRPIPPIAWIPLVILWFGVGELPKYAIIFIGSFTNITLNAYTGAQRVDPTLIGCARMLGTSDRDIFLRVILPSSLPQIFAGMQVALSTAWMAVLAAEMVGAQEGCGWIILRGSDTTNIPLVLVGMVVIGVVGLVLATLMREAERRLCSWNRMDV